MKKIAVIGGSGFYEFPELGRNESVSQMTRFSDTPIELRRAVLTGRSVFFMPRHGSAHHCPPHKINYRANIDALAALGVDSIIAVNAVGGISDACAPGNIVLPDQIVDYTWGREGTFFDEFEDEMCHVDFSYPLQSSFRKQMFDCLGREGLKVISNGVYGCMQGPRLETAAEIQKLQRDGCDLVGMTMMPEAVLAREKNISYLSICVVCNWAAGICSTKNTAEENDSQVAPLSVDDMKAVLEEKITKVRTALISALTLV